MKRRVLKALTGVLMVLTVVGCETIIGPDRKGEFRLSSQLFGSDSYYLFGYSYESNEFYRYRYLGEPEPDIINEGFRVIQGTEIVVLPGFNTPGAMNGFALIGEFEDLDEARNFYNEYIDVEEGLQFETVSDTVELYQVWIQKTALGNYAKLLVKDVEQLQGESGDMYCEVALDFTYQPNGSTTFPD